MNFMVLKPGSRFKTFGSKPKRLVIQRSCAPLWSLLSRNNKLMLIDSPDEYGLATMSQKTAGNADAPTDRWQTWKKMIGTSQLWFSSIGLHRKFGIWRRLS